MVSILLQIISVLSYNLGDAVEATMNFVELSEYHGFKAMNYTVTTPDGYILTLHRISGT